MKEFSKKERYVFDSKSFTSCAKELGVKTEDIEFRVSVLGDGAPVEVVKPTIGLCRGYAVLPSHCRVAT